MLIRSFGQKNNFFLVESASFVLSFDCLFYVLLMLCHVFIFVLFSFTVFLGHVSRSPENAVVGSVVDGLIRKMQVRKKVYLERYP